jgi:hypothetical protein
MSESAAADLLLEAAGGNVAKHVDFKTLGVEHLHMRYLGVFTALLEHSSYLG